MIAGLCASCVNWAVAATVTVAVVGLDDDPRYQARRIENHYAGHPAGRAIEAARVAAEESEPEVSSAGHTLTIKAFNAPTAASLPQVLGQIKAAKIQHVLLDLPGAAMDSLLAQSGEVANGLLLFNVSSSSDALRGAQCQAHLLHTYPSQAMLIDALAQYLAARSWNQLLTLTGPLPDDRLLQDAWQRSAKRYGLKLNRTAPFKLSADPRERDLANVRLLTGDRNHDVVAVLDSDGEFARGVPFNTQWPRPVAGSAGLTPMAWHPNWALHGGPQLSRRFMRLTKRPMESQDWAAWAAIKAVVGLIGNQPQSNVAAQLKALRSGEIAIDGFKGPRLTFRSWDGQLRQPVFLGSADGVASVAPFDGVMHPTDVLDTLGVDEKESTCRKRP